MAKKGMHIGAIAYSNFNLNGRSSDRLMLLLENLENFSEAKNFQSLLNAVLEASLEIMDAEASSLMLLDSETGELIVKLPEGKVEQEDRDKRIPKFEGYSGWVVQHQIPLVVNEVDGDSELRREEIYGNYQVENLICAPLFDKQNRIIGVIQVVNRKGESGFSKDDMPVFQVLAKHVSRAIEGNVPQGNLDSRIKEKDLMITELHHRMKNNLELISNMVEMEESKLKNSSGKQVLKNIHSRIKSINLVYELLSNQETFSEVEIGPYVKELVEGISKALDTPVRDIIIEVNADEISLHPERALAFGLILNELIVNSYKHAFKYKSEGSISIDIAKSEGTISMLYKDNGIGMPVDFDEEDYGSQGFKIIDSLTEKLYGDFFFNKKTGYKGIECTLQFPDFNFVNKG